MVLDSFILGPMADEKKTATGAEGVAWNLSDLYASPQDPGLERDMDEADRRAESLAQKYRGKIPSLSAVEMKALIGEYEAIIELAEKPAAFAALHWSAQTGDPARGALMQKCTERGSRLSQKLVFLELDWAHAPDERARKIMDDPLLSRWRHWLEMARRYKPHLLSEPEEMLLKEKAVTGKEAWVRFFEEIQSANLYEWEGASLTQDVLLSKLHEPDREFRKNAAASITKGLKVIQRHSTYIFNTLLADKASDDRLRGYKTWISSRNMDNQVEDSMVDALVAAVTSRYDIVARYYMLKKRLLGLGELFDYDRYAPLPAADRKYSWAEAKEIVLSAYGKFHPRMAEIASLFFEKKWIDAEARKGKRGGAFSASTVPSAHPYILMSFQGKANDVMTLAHELGHGVHQYLARERGILSQNTPLTTAETASTFGESLVFQDMFQREKDSTVRLAILVREIEGAFATIFRQVAMNRFEDGIHTARREEGELTVEKLSALWLDTQKAMFRDSVTLREDYGIWWSYIPHFLFAPGYVYAYAFGDLLVRALYNTYLSEGGDFPERYLALLSAGGSDWPHVLTAPLGVDLTDPAFWSKGLSLLQGMVAEAERLS
jgi:oligoendopeptidase F